jgi:hypothetical protein
VFRLRATEAHLSYQQFVCEEILGLDGPMARLAGEGLLKLIQQWRPQLERDLLAKAQQKLLEAADTKEVRVELEQLLKWLQPPS